jgi:hypothetical protein
MNIKKLKGPEKNVANDGKNMNYGNSKVGFYCTLLVLSLVNFCV